MISVKSNGKLNGTGLRWLILFVLVSLPCGFGVAEEKVRDVFQPAIVQPEQSGPLSVVSAEVIQPRLEGISMGAAGTFTVISGQIFREGEEKQGIKVTQIRKREVDIIVNGMAQTLRRIPQKEVPITQEEPSEPPQEGIKITRPNPFDEPEDMK